MASLRQCTSTSPHVRLKHISFCCSIQSVCPQGEFFSLHPTPFLFQGPALLRVWPSACSVALVQLTFPGRENLMLSCTQQVQSKLQEETLQNATLQARAVSFLVWTVDKRITLQSERTVRAAGARPVTLYSSEQVQRLKMDKTCPVGQLNTLSVFLFSCQSLVSL